MTDLAKVTAEARDEATEFAKHLRTVQALEIVTSEDFAIAADMVKGARSHWKRLDERRKAITKPILDSKKKVDELFDPALDALKEIETVLKRKIGEYTKAQEAAQIAAMQASASEYQAGGTPTAIIPEVSRAKGVSVNSVWDFEITDPERVPRHLCSPDPAKIKAEIWYADTPRTPPRNIPGITFRLRTDVIVRVK